MPSSSFFNTTNPTPTETDTAQALVDQAVATAVSAEAQYNASLNLFTKLTDTWAASMTIDWDTAFCHRVTLAGNTTFTFIGGQDGAVLILELKQDATGSRTITLPASVRYGNVSAPTLTTTANKLDRLVFVYDAAADKYDFSNFIYGF